MVIMRKEQKDLDGLGPVGILGEALKLFSAHAKAFILIQLTLMLPLAILLYEFHYWLIVNIQTVLLQHQNHLTSLAGVHIGVLFLQGDQQFDYSFAVLVLCVAVLTIVYQAALSLSQAATLYCVGCHYSGRPVSFVDAIKAATPRLWMRLAVTNTYLFVILFSSVSLLFAVLTLLHIDGEWFNKWNGIITGVLTVYTICLMIIFAVASSVSVLEEHYGWAALIKSFKLLKRRVIIAGAFQLLWIVPVYIQLRFEWEVLGQFFTSRQRGFSPWTLTLCLASIAAFFACTTFTWQVQTLCGGVEYVSFKAHHDESLADPISENRRTEGEYECLGDGSNMGLHEEQAADSSNFV